MMMFINSFLSFLALTCVSSFPLVDHTHVNGLEKKQLVTTNDIVSVSDVDNVIQISANVRDNNMVNCNENVFHSITFIGNSDVHGFGGANHITYQWSELTYDDLNHNIQTTNQDLGTYYFGFLDYQARFFTNGVATRSALVRQYFVNPKILTQGVYYIDDKTWYNLYDLTIQGNDNYECYGSWYSYYDYLNYQYDYSSWIVDDFVNNHIDFYIDTNFFAYQLPSNDLLEFAEPQRHYGDTYTINGSYNGQNLNSDYISFLPYLYFFFCDDSANLGDLYGMSNQLSLYHYKQDYLQSYQSGYDEGYQQGQQEGYQNGYSAGQEAGEENGYDNGYQAGYQTGYTNGFDEADNMDETALVIFTGIIDVGLLPVNFFLACLNFEVFGINIGAFVSALLTVAITIIVIRVIVGGKKDD